MTLPKVDLDRRNVKLSWSQIVTIGSILIWFLTQYFTLQANNDWIEKSGKPHIDNSDVTTRSAIKEEVKTQVQVLLKSEVEVLKEQMKTTSTALQELKVDLREFRKEIIGKVK